MLVLPFSFICYNESTATASCSTSIIHFLGACYNSHYDQFGTTAPILVQFYYPLLLQFTNILQSKETTAIAFAVNKSPAGTSSSKSFGFIFKKKNRT